MVWVRCSFSSPRMNAALTIGMGWRSRMGVLINRRAKSMEERVIKKIWALFDHLTFVMRFMNIVILKNMHVVF